MYGNEPVLVEHWYKESFAMLWLADHHFSIVSEFYDITDDFLNFYKLILPMDLNILIDLLK